MTRKARLLLKVSFLATFAESMLVPMYAAFTEEVGGSVLDAGIAFSVFSIATGVVIGLVGTRPIFQTHLKRFLMAGFLISALADIAYVFVHSRWQLFAVQLFVGVATGFIEPAWDSLFSDNIEHSPAKHWSIWAGGAHLVTGVAALAGGLIVAYFSFKTLFLTMSLIDFAAVYALGWARVETDLATD